MDGSSKSFCWRSSVGFSKGSVSQWLIAAEQTPVHGCTMQGEYRKARKVRHGRQLQFLLA